MSDYLTTNEVADILRTSPETVRYWRHIGTGPESFKVGRRVLYARSDVERYIREAQDATEGGGAKGVRTMEEIVAHADELARAFEDYEPPNLDSQLARLETILKEFDAAHDRMAGVLVELERRAAAE